MEEKITKGYSIWWADYAKGADLSTPEGRNEAYVHTIYIEAETPEEAFKKATTSEFSFPDVTMDATNKRLHYNNTKTKFISYQEHLHIVRYNTDIMAMTDSEDDFDKSNIVASEEWIPAGETIYIEEPEVVILKPMALEGDEVIEE